MNVISCSKFTLLSVLIVGQIAVLGCSSGDVQTSDEPGVASNSNNDASDSKTVSPVSMSAEEFAKAVKENAAEYEGRQIELSGYMTYFDKSAFGSYFFIGDEPKLADGVKFATPEDEIWSRALPFQRIKAVGVFSQATGLDNLTITEVSGDRIAVTAKQLAKEVADDNRAAKEKYAKKWMEVRGKLVKMSDSESGIELEGSQDVAIVATCATEKGLELGKEARIVGQCDACSSDKVWLSQCLPITKE